MLSALIVLYNKRIDNSLTYSFLTKYKKEINIIIFDNSSEEFIEYNNDYCKKNKIVYYTMNRNVGISKAYNYVIDRVDKNNKDYLIVLDDDTLLSDDYMNEVLYLTKKHSYDVLLPVIYSNNRIISPANVQFDCRIKILDSINDLKINNVSAINSAMVIRTSVFNKIRYNDDLFLDYVDHDFMRNVRLNGFKVHVLNNSINQNYSRFQINKLESELFRFKIYLKDFKVYCKECNNLLFYYLSTWKYRFHEFIKYKSLKFLFIK